MAEFTKDPFCGMPVGTGSPLTATSQGETYRFCSSFCRDAFLRDPAGTLARSPVASPEEDRRHRTIAYFTMEIALESAMATYSGGLGVLAGDTVRAAADLGIGFVAVTLLYREGFLAQRIDRARGQLEEPERWDLGAFLTPLAETTEVAIEGRPVRLRAWRRDVVGAGGRVVPVLFLDADLPENGAFDRSLTGRLYGGDAWYRLCQEIVLGVGGVRMLNALGYTAVRKLHLNEGHAAFAPLELARELNGALPAAAWRLDAVKDRCIFTTHTPVAAGHDQFGWEDGERACGDLVPRDILRMVGGAERLNMTTLALNLCGFVNGVAARHAEVSRAMFPGYGVEAVTNGVHPPTWAAPPFAALYDRQLPGWRRDGTMLRNALRIPRGELLTAHQAAKASLTSEIARITGRTFDPGAFTIGFARRATSYKRAGLVFSDLERLRALRGKGGRVQLVFAGKAHPKDEAGKGEIRHVLEVAEILGDDVPVVYLPNYEVDLAKLIVAGVDLWLNTPERPLEASGTSGMKAALNGVPSLSVLDGWWIEGHIEGVTGWSVGDSSTSGPMSGEAEDIYHKLETVILPAFYGGTEAWATIMQHAIALNGSFFNTHRMIQQYVTHAYL